jgi:hypothetical protein
MSAPVYIVFFVFYCVAIAFFWFAVPWACRLAVCLANRLGDFLIDADIDLGSAFVFLIFASLGAGYLFSGQ